MHYIDMLSLKIQSLEDCTIVGDNQSVHYVFISNLIIILHKK